MPFDTTPVSKPVPNDPSAPAPLISVIVPTFHRPDGALAAVRSVFAQDGAPSFEVVLVDNDAAASASKIASMLAAIAPVPFRYAVEPAAGVANARNTAVAMARGAHIAFLDDDEVALPGWLAGLHKAQATTGADVVFGPIEAVLGPGAAEPRSHFQQFFSRRMAAGPDRLIEKPWGCGNSYLVRATTMLTERPFDASTNETGGEDDLLFQGVKSRGGTFGWAAGALVHEIVPDDRASWAYLTKRAFSYGHNTSGQWFEGEHRNYVIGLGSMLRGMAQTLAMAPTALLLWLVRHERRAWAYDKMLRGLGKVLWFGPFKQAFYGESEAERQERRKGERRTGMDRRSF